MSRFLSQVSLIRAMGLRYILFRIWFEAQKRTGILKLRFPVTPQQLEISLEKWKSQYAPKFFFPERSKVTVPQVRYDSLKERAEKIKKGEFLFFSSEYISLGQSYDWVTNPENGYRFPVEKHWSEINDFSSQSGDIKFVWEKSRFGYLIDIIRFDHHFEEDSSEFVFAEISDWIEKNPLNMGPNYRCSQEISLRLFNWSFALHYYRYSASLTESLFKTIMESMYNQYLHVACNIHFSRIAVRNNHALTETLCLWLLPLVYPFFSGTQKYYAKGKKWFEEEIAYQIYEEGTFLQFSMNYHRVAVQLLTLALIAEKRYPVQLAEVVKDRSKKSLEFLMTPLAETSGELPNYGANDGALFFRFNEAGYRDYRPQLNVLSFLLDGKHLFNSENSIEDICWITGESPDDTKLNEKNITVLSSFEKSGYYIINDRSSVSFIRCGSHRDRPSQADNLHLDIWVNGENILLDAGSYKYNIPQELGRFFNGTLGHNTLMLGSFDQMVKGPRFIWFDWTKSLSAKLSETADEYIFNGEISCFPQAGKGICHNRMVRKSKASFNWVITDRINKTMGLPVEQLWHFREDYNDRIEFHSVDGKGNTLEPVYESAWYSSHYGKKEAVQLLKFSTANNMITTSIRISV